MPNNDVIEMNVIGDESDEISMDASGATGTYASLAEAWAVGQRNGEDVASTDPTYHNSAKYWAEKAASSASTATSKASTATTKATAAATSATQAATSASQAAAALQTLQNSVATTSEVEAIISEYGS